MKPRKLLEIRHLANSLFILVFVLMMEVYNVRFILAWVLFGIVSYPPIKLSF